MTVTKKGRPTVATRVLLDEEVGRLDDTRRFELLTELLDKGHSVSRRIAGGGPLADTAPRAVLAVTAPEGSASRPDDLWTDAPRLDLADLAAADVEARVGVLVEAPAGDAKRWTPWFPVIDFQRCTNCLQCLSFCLFDVYGVDADGHIEVRNEEKCKTNCPACSRVCPDIAILFPKYGKGPINGDEVREEDVEKESMKVDISALLGGDIYAALKDRSQSARKRFSTERDESKALLERKRCLKELKGALDIPDEVLMSLPSTGEIEERARRAREKMERRRARSQSVADEVAPRVPNEE